MSEAADRRALGVETWWDVMRKEPPTPDTPYKSAGIHDFVFAEMWSRPGLTRKERRWITLACVAAVGAPGPIKAHLKAALESDDITLVELREFALHYAVYCGWPSASVVDQIITELEGELGLGSAS